MPAPAGPGVRSFNSLLLNNWRTCFVPGPERKAADKQIPLPTYIYLWAQNTVYPLPTSFNCLPR